MRTATYNVDVASDRRRRENVPRHILCSTALYFVRQRKLCWRKFYESGREEAYSLLFTLRSNSNAYSDKKECSQMRRNV